LRSAFYDFSDFVRNNRGRLILLFAAGILAAAAGVRSAYLLDGAEALDTVKRYNIYRLIVGSKGFFGYFFPRLLSVTAVCAVMLLLSHRIYTAVLNILPYLFFCFMNARAAFVCAAVLKTAFLPVAAVCTVPCLLAYMFVFACLCVDTLSKSRFRRRRSDSYAVALADGFAAALSAALAAAAVCLTESALAALLVLGITL
jgi:hypothetical protein